MDKITLHDARKIITSGEAFDLQWVTCDEKRSTGGKRMKQSNLIICGSNHSDKVHGTFTAKDVAKVRAHPITIHWDLVEEINGIEVI